MLKGLNFTTNLIIIVYFYPLQSNMSIMRSATRTSKQVDDTIERTPEYNVFMKKLEEFHIAHG